MPRIIASSEEVGSGGDDGDGVYWVGIDVSVVTGRMAGVVVIVESSWLLARVANGIGASGDSMFGGTSPSVPKPT